MSDGRRDPAALGQARQGKIRESASSFCRGGSSGCHKAETEAQATRRGHAASLWTGRVLRPLSPSPHVVPAAAFSLLLLGGAQIPFLIASWKLRKLTRVVSSFRPCISSPEPGAVPARTEVFQTHGRAGRDVSSEAVCSHTSPSQAMPLRPRGGNDWPIFSFLFF